MGSQRVGHDWTTFTFIFHFAVDFLFSIPQCPSLLIHIISFLLLSLLWLLMVHAQPLHLCPSLCDPMDCSLPGSSVHGIFQTRILEWVAIPSSRGSSRLKDWTFISYVSCIGRPVLYHWATGAPQREKLLWNTLRITFVKTLCWSDLVNGPLFW